MNESSSETYFLSYENLEVHRLMLCDAQRIEAFKHAIFSLQEYIKDKVVMDVGAGTGILSVLCAKAGAKRVYAVEANEVAKLAEKVVDGNNVSHIVQVLQAPVEELELPDGEKVDAIVSEWMGFYLLHEGMLDSVIAARDKHLKPDGRMLPETAIIYACPCSLPSEFDFWTDVHGVNMSEFGRELRKFKQQQPEIMEVKQTDLLSEPHIVLELNLKTVTIADLNVVHSKSVAVVTRDGEYQGLALWFCCSFPVSHAEDKPIVLSTSPQDPLTHWKQTVIVLPDEFSVAKSEPLAWELIMKRSDDNPRQYKIEFIMLDPEKEKHPEPCYCDLTKCIVIRALLECGTKPQVDSIEFEVEN